MFLLWNPESSKWAAQVSGRYRDLVESRKTSPRDWYEEPDRDSIVDRTVEVEQCSCKRKIRAHTMITYEGEDFGGNTSVSACSKHSFARGAKQKVNSVCTLTTLNGTFLWGVPPIEVYRASMGRFHL